MRYRLMAIYLGVPYHAGLGPVGNEATLFSPAPPPDELGFTAADGHWRKQVNVTDLDALWQSRLVGPYLTGQRTVLAGYVYRAQDVRFYNPAEAYLALSLGWEDSEFTPHMSEIYLVAWLARAIDGYAPATGHGIPGFYIEPIAIPVGAGMCRLGPDGEQLVARYDGLAWQKMEP